MSPEQIALLLRKERLCAQIQQDRLAWCQRLEPASRWLDRVDAGYDVLQRLRPYAPQLVAMTAFIVAIRRGKTFSTLKTAYRLWRRWVQARAWAADLWR